MKEQIQWEFKKVIKNKGLYFLVILIVFSALSCFYQIKSNLLFSATSENEYKEILYGKFDDKKENLLQEKKNWYTELSDSSLLMLKKYQEGEITKEECQKILKDYQHAFKENGMISALSSKINYVMSDPEKHYFVDEDGWCLLLKDGIDIVVFIYIIIMIALIFYNDKKWDMVHVIRTSETGSKQIIKAKIIIFMSLLIMFICLNELLKFIIISFIYPLKGNAFPIQSIQLFSYVFVDFTIIQYYLYMLSIKMIAYLLIGLIGACLCHLLSELLHYMLSILSICLLPLIILSDKKIVGFIPFLGFLYPSRYISSDILLDHTKKLSAYTNPELFLILILTLITFTIGLSYLFEKRIHLSKKNLQITLILLLGCQPKTVNTAASSFNLTETASFSSTDSFYYINCMNDMIIVNKKNNQTYNFNRWPLWFDSNEIKQFFVTDNECFFLVDKGLWSYIIYRYNDQTGQISPIYKEQGSIPEDHFFLDEFMLPKTTSLQASVIISFFIINNHLYLYRSNNTLEDIDLEANKRETIIDNISSNTISFNNGKLFYLSNINSIYAYDLIKKEKELIIDDIIYQYKTYSNYIYYLKFSDHDALYSYSLNDGSEEKIINASVMDFSIVFDGIYYTLQNDEHTYFYSFQNKQTDILYEESFIPYTNKNQILMLDSVSGNYLIFDYNKIFKYK